MRVLNLLRPEILVPGILVLDPMLITDLTAATETTVAKYYK